jgi:phenylpropionate dioxygenase-like ring-hydroxylating dioxygenase large terminal subunit
MFINFWYAAARSTDLTDKPQRRRMLGQDFVLWRDTQGQAHCLSNTCSHRGGSLGDGKVLGDHIQCPYHGWRFDGAGQCRRIPSLGKDAAIPARTRVDAYPVVERYGLVHVFLGDLPEAERPPIMPIPEYGPAGPMPGWAATVQEFRWDIDYQRSIENGLDPGHNEFVHPTHGFSYANETAYRIPPLKLVESEWGTGFFDERWVPALPEEKMRAASGRNQAGYIRSGTGFHGAASVWTFINPSPNMHIYQYLYETPIDEEHTSLYLVNMRNFLPEDEHHERMMVRNEFVANQDRDVLEQLHPVVTPRTTNHELFTPSDRCIGRYRQHVAAWTARGWRIDTETVRANRLKVAYAIPSPGRREHKGWVLDAVPLVAASTDAISNAPGAEVA